MKISIIYDFFKELGGLERVMVFRANLLSKGNDVELVFGYVSDEEKNIIAKELKLNDKISIKQIGKGKNEIFQLIKFFLNKRKLNNIKTDLIISHSFMASKMAYKKNKEDKTPYIVVMHHPPNFLYSNSLDWANNVPRFFAYVLGKFVGSIIKKIDKKSVRGANFVIVNSNYTARRIKEIYNINSKVIYPTLSKSFKIIDENKSKEIIKKFDIKNKFIYMTGRMIKDKKPDWGVLAFSKLKNIDFVISGTIEEEDKLKKLIEKLGLINRVKVLGRVSNEELVALYNQASCFLMPAPKEDFGLTPIEAMACGCPVVAWNDGAGPNETVINGLNGYLSNPYDINDFTNKINKVLGSKWNKKKISKSVEKFSEDNISKSFLDVINKIPN